MPQGMLIIFSPIIGVFFGFVGVIVEFLLNKFFVPLKSNSQAFLYDSFYAFPLLYLIDWRLLILLIFLNPIVLRLMNKKFPSWNNRNNR
jgi:hypothetical protein